MLVTNASSRCYKKYDQIRAEMANRRGREDILYQTKKSRREDRMTTCTMEIRNKDQTKIVSLSHAKGHVKCRWFDVLQGGGDFLPELVQLSSKGDKTERSKHRPSGGYICLRKCWKNV